MDLPDLEHSRLDPKQLLLQALEMRWESYRLQLQNCQTEFTDEAVHDLRVATRRILAFIQLLNSILPRPHLKKLARIFKEQLDEFDGLRDTQVILEELNEILPELPQLQGFQEHLFSVEKELLQKLGRRLKELDTSRAAAGIHKTYTFIESELSGNLHVQILEAVDEAFLVARLRLGWIDLSRPATIHRVRVAFKAFRYMVEIVYPLLSRFPEENLKKMNEYQTLMGDIQDAEVFAQTFADFSEHASVRDLGHVRCYEENRLSAALTMYASNLGQLRAFWRLAPEQPFPWEKAK